ncbi:hypothetical protein [Halorhodospira halochloris]|uniref:hypothetical protein n=1 Tax=Halorhodospira halochloris TaxID=1052 RepID=UPI0013A52F13|nr:hypothetical protein [Halorhodospira halochloris]
MEGAVNPSLEASWRHPWRQELHTWAVSGSGVGSLLRGALRLRWLSADKISGESP